MKLLALDISMENSGWAVFHDTRLVDYGVLTKGKYPLQSKDRYPKRTAKWGKIMALKLETLIRMEDPDVILIEEVSMGGVGGVKSIKGLCQVHGMLLFLIEDYLDKVKMKPPQGKDGWRTILKLKKNGNWKLSAVVYANKVLGTKLADTEHDSADAILLGHSEVNNV